MKQQAYPELAEVKVSMQDLGRVKERGLC